MRSPPTPDEWEVALTRHYLRSDGPGGGAPLAYIDASPGEFAAALGERRADGEDLLCAFIACHRARSVLDDFFQHGWKPSSRCDDTPGWFRFLMLSCVIASLSPDESESGQFRERFRERLALDPRLENFSALPRHWEALRAWCLAKRREGLPIRELILPHPGHMSQIGYSVRIVFPSRHDLALMQTRFSGMGDGCGLAASHAIASVRRHLHEASWSQAFRAIFADFEARYRRNERLLADHPFWVAFQRVACADGTAGGPEYETRLELTTDLDGLDELRVETDNPRVRELLGHLAPGSFDGAIGIGLDDVARLASGDAAGVRDRSLAQLKRSVAHGALPFEMAAFSGWKAVALPAGDQARLLLRRDIARRAGIDSDGGAWVLTGVLHRSRFEPLLAPAPTGTGAELRRVVVRHGIRVGSAFLGRAGFLPEVVASDGVEPCLDSVRVQEGELLAKASPGGVVRLLGSDRLEGAWRLRLGEAGRNGSARSEVLLRFTASALEHADPRFAETSMPGWDDQPECETRAARPLSILPARLETVETPDPAMAALLEAVYAGGARGWDEKNLVELVHRLLGRETPLAWDVIRLLHEAGWIAPKVAATWRARRWFLRAPRLAISICGRFALLDGAAPEVLRDRLAATVVRRGGAVRTRRLSNAFSVPAIMAEGECLHEAAEDVGIPAERPLLRVPAMGGRLQGIRSSHDPRFRILASAWDWRAGGFRQKPPALRGSDRVRLERLARSRGDARDVYRIEIDGAGDVVLDSRTAAIVEAHIAARRPLFAAGAGEIVRVPFEGHLPIEIARLLATSAGVNSAIRVTEDKRPSYVYPVPDGSMSDLRDWLGPALDGAGGVDTSLIERVLTRRIGAAGSIVALRLWGGAAKC